MAVAVLHNLRERSQLHNTPFIVTPNGHRVSKVVFDRIESLKSRNELNTTELLDEIAGIIELCTSQKPTVTRRKAKIEKTETFCAEFLEFLATGDYSGLAPSGIMSPEMFKKTQDYIFCNVLKVNGKTAQCAFFSNSTRRCDGVLIDGLKLNPGPAVILRKGMILDALNLTDDFAEQARSFNSLAARSKV